LVKVFIDYIDANPLEKFPEAEFASVMSGVENGGVIEKPGFLLDVREILSLPASHETKQLLLKTANHDAVNGGPDGAGRLGIINKIIDEFATTPPSMLNSIVKIINKAYKHGSLDEVNKSYSSLKKLGSLYGSDDFKNDKIEKIISRMANGDGTILNLVDTYGDIANDSDIDVFDFLSSCKDLSVDDAGEISRQIKFNEALVKLLKDSPNREELNRLIGEFNSSELNGLNLPYETLISYLNGDIEIEALKAEYVEKGLSTRKQEAESWSHFDESQILRVIDELQNVSGNPELPLNLNARRKLSSNMMYINGIGKDLPLPQIEGLGRAKPVLEMTDNEIKKYIDNCRNVAQNSATSQEGKERNQLIFIALMRESLCRSTRDDSFAGVFAYTSQIISLLNSIEQGNMHLSEIETGQGKSHIAALHAGLRWLDGDTVNVCTSNMDLAQEGMEEHKDFFELIGARASLINGKSDAGEYQVGGINYSTVSDMSLFKSRTMVDGTLKVRGKSALVLDEADFTTLDDTVQYKYAGNVGGSQTTDNKSPYPWVYTYINNFIDTSAFKNTNADRQDDIANLKRYINEYAKDSEKEIFARILGGGADLDVKIDSWLDAALAAKNLQGFGEYRDEKLGDRSADFVVEEDDDGIANARIIIHGSVSRDAKWSDGIHQFMHARLNASGKSEGTFPIEAETTHLASTNAKDFIDSFDTTWGMTGTIGSEAERLEQKTVYGFKMTKISPHRMSHRQDNSAVLTQDTEAHNMLIMDTLKEKIRKNKKMPSVLVCKDMESSQGKFEMILDSFKQDSKNKKMLPLRIQIFNGKRAEIHYLQWDSESKQIISMPPKIISAKEAKDNAGESGTITVTTPIMGRGTDFKPKLENGKDHPSGLLVLNLHLAQDRDHRQIIGRSGRNGAVGETLSLINYEDIKKELGEELGNMDLTGIVEGVRSNRSAMTKKQRQERQAIGSITTEAFTSLLKMIEKIEEFRDGVFDQYQSKIDNIDNKIKVAEKKEPGDDGFLTAEQIVELTLKKSSLFEERENILKKSPSRNEILSQWAGFLTDFKELSQPHNVDKEKHTVDMAIRVQLMRLGSKEEYKDLSERVNYVAQETALKWNVIVGAQMSRMESGEFDVSPDNALELRSSMKRLESGLRAEKMDQVAFAKDRLGYIERVKNASEYESSPIPTAVVVTSAKRYLDKTMAFVDHSRPEDITSEHLEQAFREQILGTIRECKLDPHASGYIKTISLRKMSKLKGDAFLVRYREVLMKLEKEDDIAGENVEHGAIARLKQSAMWLNDKIEQVKEVKREEAKQGKQGKTKQKLKEEFNQDPFIIEANLVSEEEILFSELQMLTDQLKEIWNEGNVGTCRQISNLEKTISEIRHLNNRVKVLGRSVNDITNMEDSSSKRRLVSHRMKLSSLYRNKKDIDTIETRLFNMLEEGGDEKSTLLAAIDVSGGNKDVQNKIDKIYKKRHNLIYKVKASVGNVLNKISNVWGKMFSDKKAKKPSLAELLKTYEGSRVSVSAPAVVISQRIIASAPTAGRRDVDIAATPDVMIPVTIPSPVDRASASTMSRSSSDASTPATSLEASSPGISLDIAPVTMPRDSASTRSRSSSDASTPATTLGTSYEASSPATTLRAAVKTSITIDMASTSTISVTPMAEKLARLRADYDCYQHSQPAGDTVEIYNRSLTQKMRKISEDKENISPSNSAPAVVRRNIEPTPLASKRKPLGDRK